MDPCEQTRFDEVCKLSFDRMSTKLDHMADQIDRLDTAIRGNGHIGLNGRVDRLERSEATRSRMLWTIMTTTVGLAGHAVWQILSRG
jgi:hypothetical protein